MVKLEEKLKTFTDKDSKHYLNCYPITKEYILSLKLKENYYYYDKNSEWAFVIVKHEII